MDQLSPVSPETPKAAEPATPKPARPPRRISARPPTPKPASKVKVTICLSPEALTRLVVHAHMQGIDRSELVESFITERCRRFVIQDRGRDTVGDRQTGAAA